jgi:hypothetical protein
MSMEALELELISGFFENHGTINERDYIMGDTTRGLTDNIQTHPPKSHKRTLRPLLYGDAV